MVTLVDTPGFDDTTVSDTDILKMIAVYLSSTYVPRLSMQANTDPAAATRAAAS